MNAALAPFPALTRGGAGSALAVLALLCIGSPSPGFAGERLPKIALNDQFDRLHRHQGPFPRPLIVVIADRRGASQIEGWVSKLYQSHGTTADIVGVADLRGVPPFMQDTLRKAFRKQCADYPILLDWEGQTTSAVSRGQSGIDIFAVSPGGEIVATVSGCLTAAKLQRLDASLQIGGIVASAP